MPQLFRGEPLPLWVHKPVGLATTNRHKVEETQAILSDLLGCPIEVRMLVPDDVVEETGTTFEANARIKLAAAASHSDAKACGLMMAEDSGLVVSALGVGMPWTPFPGVWSDRWLEQLDSASELLRPWVERGLDPPPNLVSFGYREKCLALLSLLEGQSDRRAWYQAAIASQLSLDSGLQSVQVALGEVPLWVAHSMAGEGGFGYDPIMKLATGRPTDRWGTAEFSDRPTIAQLPAAQKNAVSHRAQALTSVVAQWLRVRS